MTDKTLPVGPKPSSPKQAQQPGNARHRGLEGSTLGDCSIETFLGVGGMAAVYQAEQQGLERKVAVKVLSQQLTKDPKQVEQFMREARALAKVEHPNIVRIYSVGQDEGLHYLVVQLVAAGSLRGLLERETKLPPERAVKAAREICLGLGAAHKAGIVHRDVKPDNVLVGNEGEMLLTDFGLARMLDDPTQSVGKIQGTPHYIPPEQVDGRDVDARADLYSLGATLYHLLIGEPPFSAKSAYELLLKHVGEVPRPPSERDEAIPEALSRVVCRLLEKDPADRYADVGEVLAALDAAQAGGEPAAPPAAEPTRRAPPTPELLLTPELPPLELPPAPVPAARGRWISGAAALALVGIAAFAWPDLALAFGGGQAPERVFAQRALDQLDRAGLPPAAALGALEELRAALPGQETLLEARGAELEAELASTVRPSLEQAQGLLDEGKPGPALELLVALPEALPAEVGQRRKQVMDAARARLDEAGFAWVPGGRAPSGEGRLAVERDVAGCYLSLREVTRAEYARVALERGFYLPWGEGAPPIEEADLPVVGLNLGDAARYAAAVGCRLPTAYEWERAARGLEGRRWPWGDRLADGGANWAAGGGVLSAPGATAADVSPLGCFDMAGNAAELTLAPDHTAQAPRAWVRGGSYLTRDPQTARGAFFLAVEADARHANVGLRLAADALPEGAK